MMYWRMAEFKYLDVCFDQYLRWDTSIDKAATKMSQRFGVLNIG